MVVDSFGWLWIVVGGYGCLWVVVGGSGSLWVVFWVVVNGCEFLWMVVGSCGWLWMVIGGCGWLWMVVASCGWLWVVPYFSTTQKTHSFFTQLPNIFYPLEDSERLLFKFSLQSLNPSRKFPKCFIIFTSCFIVLDFCKLPSNIIFLCFLYNLFPNNLEFPCLMNLTF